MRDIVAAPSRWSLLPLALLAACGGGGEGRQQRSHPDMAKGSPESRPAPVDTAGLPAAAGPRGRTDTVPARDGVTIVYSLDGPPVEGAAGDAPPALVFIHCWSCDRGFWDGQVREFGRRRTVVAVDLPGHGGSGADRAAWSLEEYGEDVRRVVERLGLEKVVLIGHSLGGTVALEAARLLGTRAVMVIGVDTMHDLRERLEAGKWEEFVRPFEVDFPGQCAGFVKGIFPPDADTGLVARTSGSMCDAEPRIAVALLRLLPAYDEEAAARALPCPLRLIQGTLFPTNVAGNKAVAGDFEAVFIEGTGHFPHLERPEEFNRKLADLLQE